MNLRRLQGNRIVVRNAETGELLADTKIIDSVPERNVVKIFSNSVTTRKTTQITALIFDKNALYEYDGKMGGLMTSNMLEVALSKGKEKESRCETRYPVKTDGIIEAIIYKHCKVFLRRPIWVTTKNISVNGVLMSTYAGSLQVGDQIQVALDLQGKELRKKYEVVRKQRGGNWTEEYGCKGIDWNEEE